MYIKRIKVKCATFMTLLSSLKDTCQTNLNSLGKAKCEFYFCNFDWKFAMRAPLSFSFSENYEKSEIW